MREPMTALDYARERLESSLATYDENEREGRIVIRAARREVERLLGIARTWEGDGANMVRDLRALDCPEWAFDGLPEHAR